MNRYGFVIKLEGAVMANNEKEAHEKINLHLNDLGEVGNGLHFGTDIRANVEQHKRCQKNYKIMNWG
jgi:hypothetical protein